MANICLDQIVQTDGRRLAAKSDNSNLDGLYGNQKKRAEARLNNTG
jgi:hypothetical protein|tara:strand:+ start:327 stop:464 length:138 start_codon:yes stop_codon:yes gene_type:complete